jgi:drug/metabolite transporter (DMT)-like permease
VSHPISPHRAIVYAWLAVGVASVSGAAIFIRLADDAEPLAIAAYRMLIGAAFVAIPTLLRSRRELFGVGRRDLVLLALSGLFLAGHFASWITSLTLTSVASSVLLVTMTPVFIAIVSHFWLHDRVRPATSLAIGISLAGGAVLAFGEWDGASRRLAGDALALGGAVMVGTHMLIGRRVRGRGMGNLPYSTIVYTIAAVALLIAVLVARVPMLGLSPETYFWIAMAAILPQAIGHSLVNWTLGHISATNVSLAILAEPIIAIALALLVLSETPAWTVVPGGVLIMLGVYLAIRSDTQRQNPTI